MGCTVSQYEGQGKKKTLQMSSVTVSVDQNNASNATGSSLRNGTAAADATATAAMETAIARAETAAKSLVTSAGALSGYMASSVPPPKILQGLVTAGSALKPLEEVNNNNGCNIIFVFGGPGSHKGDVVDMLCDEFGFEVWSLRQYSGQLKGKSE